MQVGELEEILKQILRLCCNGMKFYRLRFVANAFLLLFSIYLTNKNLTINKFMIDMQCGVVVMIPDYVSFLVYFLIPIGLAYINSKRFDKLDKFNVSGDLKIESASGTFLPIFFGYIFVGLSISTFSALLIIYVIMTILCYCAEIYLYNPIYHLLGYKFYFVTIKHQKMLVMTKRNIKLQESIEFKNLGRINDFTYVDVD